MSVHLNLPNDLEAAVRALAMQAGENIESFLIKQIAVSLRRQFDVRTANSVLSQTNDSLADRLDRWTALHPVVDYVDDSRESIYAGRE